MTWAFHNTSKLGLPLLLLLLLFLLLLQNPSSAHENPKFSRATEKGSDSADLNALKIHQNGGIKAVRDELFGAEKRRVNTGPNPLHNR
ncbi:hypothetical protein ACS0TY_031051 [Phlomoides rotata]